MVTMAEVVVYKGDPELPLRIVSYSIEAAFMTLRDWMDGNRRYVDPFSNPEADGLTIYLDDNRQCPDPKVIVLERCNSDVEWSIRRNHSVDNSLEGWHIARDIFIAEVRDHGEAKWIDVN